MYLRQRNFTLSQDLTGSRESATGRAGDENARIAPAGIGYLASLLDALHHSRRLQAARVIRQHQHLVAEKNSFRAMHETSEQKVSEGSGPSMKNEESSSAKRWPMVKGWALIAVVVGFAILHLVGAVLLHDSSSARPTEVAHEYSWRLD
jgi:hypothetical protein